MKNEDIPERFLPKHDVEIGDLEKGYDMPEKFLPDESVEIGRDEEYSSVESHSSLFNYLNERVCESRFELSKGVEGFRGSSVLYEDENSVLVVSDSDEGIGIDLFSFEDSSDIDSVREWLYEGSGDTFPDAQNSLHYVLDGEEAYNQVFKITDTDSVEAGGKLI